MGEDALVRIQRFDGAAAPRKTLDVFVPSGNQRCAKPIVRKAGEHLARYFVNIVGIDLDDETLDINTGTPADCASRTGIPNPS